MNSTVTKAAWCVMILFIIPTQTSNGINEAKKPSKHDETLDENSQMSRDRTSVENNRVCHNMNDDTPRGPLQETLFMTPDDETLTSREKVRVNPDFKSTGDCIGFDSAETGDPRKRHCAEISDEPRKNACHDQSGSYGHDQTKVPSQNFSNADKPPKVTYSSFEQSIVDKHGDTSSSTSCNEPITDSQQTDDDTNVNNPSTKASTIPPVADVNPYEKEPIVELKKTSDQACNNFESQTQSQTPASFTFDEPNTEQCSVESQDNEPCNDTCIANIHTEEQFTREISKFIVNLTNNDRGVIKVGEMLNLKDYKLQVIYLQNQSCVFKTNFNGRDLIIKYLKYIRSYEKEIVVKVKHKNIVEVYDSFYTEDKRGFFIVMEAMDCDLSKFSYKHPDKIKDAVKSVVDALQYLHCKGIAHCDIKLENILTKTVKGETVYKLCDFGCALYIDDDDEMTEPGNYICTKAYQAPEMFFLGVFLKKTDIWLLGHTIWYYIDRDNKFYDEYGRFDTDKYKKYLKSPQECPHRKNRLEIINKCCTGDPEERASFETILEWCNEGDEPQKILKK